MSRAGNLPKDLGFIDLPVGEMMFWMYLPISLSGSHIFVLPKNLQHLAPLVKAVQRDDPSAFFLRYVYLTAKTLWIEGDYVGNRPGWHIDGYGTNDVNYIWSDRAPTEFLTSQQGWYLSDDCDKSLCQMAEIGRRALPSGDRGRRVAYPDRHLLRLDNTVIHRSPVEFEPGVRSFVKVSLSHDRYNLRGNSINHDLPDTHWPLVERRTERNHPAKDAA